MDVETQAVPTKEEVQAVLKPETVSPKQFSIGDKSVAIRPMKRRWQAIFFASAWPIIEAKLRAPESILKSILDKTFMFDSTVGTIVKAQLEEEAHLDRAAAVIIASQMLGAEKNTEDAINQALAFVLDNATTEVLQQIVDAQIEQERLAEKVGEALPARFVALLNLAGVKGTTTDTVMPHLISSLSKLRESIGGGN